MLFQNYTNAQGPAQFQAFLTMTSLAMQGLIGPRGQVFWVDASHPYASSDGGRQPTNPASTLSAALSLCESGRGDAIILAPTHSETITAEVSIAKDDVAIVGSGNGSPWNKPFITCTGASVGIALDAANLTLKGFELRSATGSHTGLLRIGITTAVTDALIDGLTLRKTAGSATALVLINNASNARICIQNCHFKAIAAAGTNGVTIADDIADFIFRNNTMLINGTGACINTSTATATLAGFLVTGNRLTNVGTGGLAFRIEENAATNIGEVSFNSVNCKEADATPGAISVGTTTDIYFVQNYGHDGVGLDSGLLNPAADS